MDIGLAAGSIVADISAQFPNVVVPVTILSPEELQATASKDVVDIKDLGFPEPWLAPSVSATITLTSTLIVALIIWGILKLFEGQNRP